MSTDVVTREETGLAISDADLEALLATQEAEFDDGFFQVPILKIGQPLTKEVQADEAEAGEFINTLLGEGIGNKIGFIVAYYQQGRFAADRDSGRGYSAFTSTIPEHWAELVGDEYVGTPFDEYPDAEEVYKKRVNAKEIEWGKGPLVSTTHNFTGYALVPSIDLDESDEMQPVRLSLKRTDVPMARKLLTLKKAALRGRPFWDVVFDLSTKKEQFDKGMAHLLTVKLGRQTTAEERQAAVELAQAVAAGRVSDNQASADVSDKPSVPDAQGGLDV